MPDVTPKTGRRNLREMLEIDERARANEAAARDVTPKTESGRALLHDILAIEQEAASKAVAEVRGPFNALTADWPPIQRSKALAAFDAAVALIASERKP